MWELGQIKKYLLKRVLLYITVALGLFIYFSTVFCSWIYPDRNPIARIVFLTIFHMIFFLLVWSFIQTIRTDPGRVPDSTASPYQRENMNCMRVCMNCYTNKPERTHHCSKCDRCILVMDHHCPWLNSCIGLRNKKFFILLVVYTLSISFLILFGFCFIVYDVLTDSFDRVSSEEDDEMSSSDWVMTVFAVIGVILIFILSISLTIFLDYHLDLIRKNKTTLEEYNARRFIDISPAIDYNIGEDENFKQVFGEIKWTYPFPIFLSTDGPTVNGVNWPKRIKTSELNLARGNTINFTEQRDIPEKPENIEVQQPEVKLKTISASMQTSHSSVD